MAKYTYVRYNSQFNYEVACYSIDNREYRELKWNHKAFKPTVFIYSNKDLMKMSWFGEILGEFDTLDNPIEVLYG